MESEQLGLKRKNIDLKPYLRPIITDSVRENLAIIVESTTGDALLHGFTILQFGSSVFVPEAEPPVRTNSGQSAVCGVEFDVIDSVDFLVAVGRAVAAVALECEVVPGTGGIDVLNGHSPLNRAESKSCWQGLLVSEDTNTTMLKKKFNLSQLIFCFCKDILGFFLKMF